MKNAKLLLFCLLLTLSYTKVSSQGFNLLARDSVEWVINWQHYGGSSSYIIYKLNGDTTVNDKVYYKSYLSNNMNYHSNNDDSLYCLIRSDSLNRVFVKYLPPRYKDTAEFLLYDFNLSIGDTLSTKCKLSPEDSSFTYLRLYEVLDTGSITYSDNIKRKAFQIGSNGYIGFWIEGIGDLTHPFHCELVNGFDFFDAYQVDCFFDRNAFIFGLCNPNNIIENNLQESTVDVYPSITRDVVNIHFNDIGEYAISLVTIYGESIDFGKTSNSDVVLNLMKYPGIHVIIIKDEYNKIIYVNKVIII